MSKGRPKKGGKMYPQRGRSFNGKGKAGNKPKEFEVNVKDSSANLEDLASIIKDNKVGKQNDPSWYAQNPQLLRDAANFPYSWPVGSPYDLEFGEYSDAVLSQYRESVPGILSIEFSPTIGYSVDPTSPINLAARQIYSFVRHANSGHSNYDSPDLMMYLIAMDSAYMWLSYMTRVYGTAMVYSPVNRYLPKALLKAQGVDAEDVFQNLAQLRFYINEYAYKLASMCVPGGMTYFTRHAWLSSNVYKDSASDKSQLYLFYPSTYYVFREQVNGPAFLTARSANSPDMGKDGFKYLTISDLVQIGAEIIEPILSSEDFNIMSGDILKAFGSDNLIKVAPISEDYTVMPVFVPEVNSQIENLVAVGHGYATQFGSVLPSTPGRNDITQDVNTNAIIQTYHGQNWYLFGGSDAASIGLFYYSDYAGSFWTSKIKMNMHNDVVTPEMTMVASRLIPTAVPYKITGEGEENRWVTLDLTAYGSEVVNCMHLFTMFDGEAMYDQVHKENMSLSNIIDFTAIGDVSTNFNTAGLGIMTGFAQFDWSPALRIMTKNIGSGQNGTYWGDTFDTDNYTLIDHQSMYRMHETALLSMFSVPQMASISAKPMNK